MTRAKAETIERMILKELCRESLADLLEYWGITESELDFYLERAKADLPDVEK
jgi:hypothetical protein